MTPSKKLGELLLEADVITVGNLERALEVQSDSGERLGSVLLRLELVDAALLASTLARQQGVEAVDLQTERPTMEALAALTREQAYRLGCIPLRLIAGELAVAFMDPGNSEGVSEVARATGRQVRCMVAPQTAIYTAIMRYYPPEGTRGHCETGGERPPRSTRESTMRIVVLGCGLVGHAIVADLAAEPGFEITAVDRDPGRLQQVAGIERVTTRVADLADPAVLASAVAGGDLVVGAVPGFMGFETVRRVLELGRPVVDISFFPEDPFGLDGVAKAQGLVALVDCGIAPGCSNLLAGWATRRLDEVERFVCYVGGLPVIRTWPWEYKAPFSPADVLEEYTRPARFVEGRTLVTRPALSDPELIEFPGIGTLEAFNTDGLRSLLTTLSIPNMIEKTLRYPGHIEKIRVLRESGFLSTEPVKVGDASIAPLALASRLLFPLWQLGPTDEDFTVMRVTAEGRRDGKRLRLSWDLLDRYDPTTGTASMARTTGYTCTAIVRMVAQGRIPQTGIVPLEVLGQDDGLCRAILADLARRQVVFHEREEVLG